MNTAVQLVFLAVVWTQLTRFTHAYEYCENKAYLCTNAPGPHIICNQSTVDLGTELVGVVPMTMKLKNMFLDLHDECRNKVACGEIKDAAQNFFPQATRMRNLIWDYELAYIATVHAQRCNMQHDKCRNTDRHRYSGQNLYYSSNTKPRNPIKDEIKASVINWFDEYKLVKDGAAAAKQFPKEDLMQVGHFTAMVNDRVSRIGCGMTYCIDRNKTPNWYNYYITCNYDFTNMGRMYADGDAKSKCDEWETTPSSKYSCMCNNNGKIFG